MKYILRDLSTGKLFAWTLKQILKEINRDRSDDWTPYNHTDWQEGWKEWCEGDCYILIGKVRI